MQTTLYYCSFYNTFLRRDIIFSLSYTILYCHISATLYNVAQAVISPLFIQSHEEVFYFPASPKITQECYILPLSYTKIFYYDGESFYVSIILKTKAYVNEGRELVIHAKRGILHLIRSSPHIPAQKGKDLLRQSRKSLGIPTPKRRHGDLLGCFYYSCFAGIVNLKNEEKPRNPYPELILGRKTKKILLLFWGVEEILLPLVLTNLL